MVFDHVVLARRTLSTSILFFDTGSPAKQLWYYEVPMDANSINAAGSIAGFYAERNYSVHGFLRAHEGTITVVQRLTQVLREWQFSSKIVDVSYQVYKVHPNISAQFGVFSRKFLIRLGLPQKTEGLSRCQYRH